MEELAKFVYHALFVPPAPKKWTTKDLRGIVSMYEVPTLKKQNQIKKFKPRILSAPSRVVKRKRLATVDVQTLKKATMGKDVVTPKVAPIAFSHSPVNSHILQQVINDPTIFNDDFTSANLVCKSAECGNCDDDNVTLTDVEDSCLDFFVKMDVELAEMNIPTIPTTALKRKKQIAAGSFGICYDVEFEGHPFVSKKFDSYEELLREIKYLYRVKHVPNVQQIVGVCMDEMELITVHAGSDLESYYKKPVSEAKTFKIIKRLLGTIIVLNEFGIAHNDIKLTNVCIRDHMNGGEDDDDFDLTLIDFGLANKLGSCVFKPFAYKAKDHVKFKWLSKELLLGIEGSSLQTEAYSIMYLIYELTLKHDRLTTLLNIK